MSAEIIPFAEAVERLRRRQSARMTAADLFWASAICFAPFCMALFIGQAVLDGFLGERRR